MCANNLCQFIILLCFLFSFLFFRLSFAYRMVIFVMQCSNVVAVARPILADASLHPARCSGCAYHARPAAPRVPSALRLQPQSQPPRVTLRRSTCAVHVSNVPLPELGSVMKSCKNFLNLSCNLLLRVSFPAFLRNIICNSWIACCFIRYLD